MCLATSRVGLMLALGIPFAVPTTAWAQRGRGLPAAPRPAPAHGYVIRSPAPIGYTITPPLAGPAGTMTNPAMHGLGAAGGFNRSMVGQPGPFQQGLYNMTPPGPGPFDNLYQNSYFNNPFQPMGSPFANPYMNGMYPNNLNMSSPFNPGWWPTPMYPGVLAPPPPLGP